MNRSRHCRALPVAQPAPAAFPVEQPPITATIGGFVKLSGISRSKVYELLSDGRLEGIRVDGRRLVLLASYHRLVARQLEVARDVVQSKPGGPRLVAPQTGTLPPAA